MGTRSKRSPTVASFNSIWASGRLGVWASGGRRFDVQGFSVAATAGDLSAVVKYVTPGGLVQDVLDSEADTLLGYVKMQYPELAKRFDAVIFEAYESAPDSSKAGEELNAYRTVRRFASPAANDG